jgi:hypothetical protein
MIVIPCTMFVGGFSGEIGFEIKHANGKHVGLASRRYFWKKNRKPLALEAVTDQDQGYITVRILPVRAFEEKGDSVLVSIPDGEVVSVRRTDLQRFPEPLPNVPVGS